jgi:hypothetical protein
MSALEAGLVDCTVATGPDPRDLTSGYGKLPGFLVPTKGPLESSRGEPKSGCGGSEEERPCCGGSAENWGGVLMGDWAERTTGDWAERSTGVDAAMEHGGGLV